MPRDLRSWDPAGAPARRGGPPPRTVPGTPADPPRERSRPPAPGTHRAASTSSASPRRWRFNSSLAGSSQIEMRLPFSVCARHRQDHALNFYCSDAIASRRSCIPPPSCSGRGSLQSRSPHTTDPNRAFRVCGVSQRRGEGVWRGRRACPPPPVPPAPLVR